MVRCKLWVVCLVGLFLVAAEAKETPGQTVVWPENGQPILRFVFGKFKEGPAYGREHNYTCETTAQNLWSKKIDAVFSLYLFDKSSVRIGEGYVQVSNVGARRNDQVSDYVPCGWSSGDAQAGSADIAP